MSIPLPFDARLPAHTLVVDPPLTDEQLEELCRANEDVRIERTKQGIIRMNSPAGGLTAMAMQRLVGSFAPSNTSRGEWRSPRILFLLAGVPHWSVR
jgi:hypothetical protein